MRDNTCCLPCKHIAYICDECACELHNNKNYIDNIDS